MISTLHHKSKFNFEFKKKSKYIQVVVVVEVTIITSASGRAISRQMSMIWLYILDHQHNKEEEIPQVSQVSKNRKSVFVLSAILYYSESEYQ